MKTENQATTTAAAEPQPVQSSAGEANAAAQQSPPPSPPPASPPPPRGPAGWVIASVIGAFVIALVIGVSFADRLSAGTSHFARAMLSGHDHADHAEGGAGQYYTCGMHPWVILPRPGDCPICHMELTPIDPAKFKGEVSIDPVVVQNMGVRITPVTTGPLVRQVRTVGTIEYAEPLVRDVNTKVGGWIEKLHVDSVGARVNAGDVLFEIYSPELYAAQEEYLLALRSQGKVGTDAVPSAARTNEHLLESARTKLAYFDITPEQIADLERSGVPSKTMAVRSPHDGYVIEKEAFEGMQIDPGMRTYRIADLSRVWVMATIYEYQLPYVEVGQAATMSLPYVPGEAFEGKVIYVYPYLSEQSREVKVRLEFENASGALKPGMFARVELSGTIDGDRVLAPREAIIDTGKRQVAFVSLGKGRFEPRDVQVGIESEDGQVEILSGLAAGEMVVTSGQFLIDSEARIRESLAKMIQGQTAADQPSAGAGPAAASTVKPPQFRPTEDGTGWEQATCLVSGLELGAMGEPVEHTFDGMTIRFCCADCIDEAIDDPAPFIEALQSARDAHESAGQGHKHEEAMP